MHAGTVLNPLKIRPARLIVITIKTLLSHRHEKVLIIVTFTYYTDAIYI